MKLSTMILPTGEFMLIGSECKGAPPAPDLFRQFRKRTGAAAVFVTTEEVEVENAIIDEGGWRRELDPCEDDEPEEQRPETDFTRTYIPRAKLGDQTLSPDFTVASSDVTLMEQILGGREFSPAGLVKGRPGDHTVTTEELEGTPGADPEPEISVVAGDLSTAEPEFAPGDRVIIRRVNGFWADASNHYNGKEGTVERVLSSAELDSSETRGWVVRLSDVLDIFAVELEHAEPQTCAMAPFARDPWANPAVSA